MLTPKPIALTAAFLSAFLLLLGSYFTVDQTELANVRRFGTVLHDRPLRPGFHLKLPLIDTVDRRQVTLQTLHIPPFDVLTVDNQKVTIEENFNYTISPERFQHVMYEVGAAGNVDIESQVIPVARDRTARVFAAQNMVTVNANRQEIQQQVERDVTAAVETLFGVTAHSLQIAAITPSANFMHSIDEATMAKNAAIAAENQLRTRQFEAQQVVATARGAADAAIERARGEAESTRLNAQAEKSRSELTGAGLGDSFTSQIKPFGDPDRFIEYIRAKAANNWDGRMPQVQTTGAGPNLVIPLPEAKRP